MWAKEQLGGGKLYLHTLTIEDTGNRGIILICSTRKTPYTEADFLTPNGRIDGYISVVGGDVSNIDTGQPIAFLPDIGGESLWLTLTNGTYYQLGTGFFISDTVSEF